MSEADQNAVPLADHAGDKPRGSKIPGEWKELLSLAVAAGGLLYGIGWALQYQAACRMGVGPISVSREAALATALALIGLLLPSIIAGAALEWTYKNFQGKSSQRWAVIVGVGLLSYLFSGFMICWMPLLMGNGSPALKGTISAFLVFAFCFMLFFFLLRVVLNMKIALVVLGLILVVGLTQSFSDLVLSKLPEAFGGPGTSRVVIEAKEPAQTITATLAMSDDKFLILKDTQFQDATGGATGKSPVCRLPVERVLQIRPSNLKP